MGHHAIKLRNFEDQIGSPTWCRGVAEATTHMISLVFDGGLDKTEAAGGLFHIGCRGAPSRYELALEIVSEVRLDGSVVIKRATSEKFPAPAQQPRFSALDCTHFQNTFSYELPTWKEALHTAMAN